MAEKPPTAPVTTEERRALLVRLPSRVCASVGAGTWVTTFVISVGQGVLFVTDGPWPWISGAAAGCVAPLCTAIYCCAEAIRPRSAVKHLLVLVPLIAWSGFHAVPGLMGAGEKPDLATMVGVASLVGGLVAWILCAVRLPDWANWALAASGGVFWIWLFFAVTNGRL